MVLFLICILHLCFKRSFFFFFFYMNHARCQNLGIFCERCKILVFSFLFALCRGELICQNFCCCIPLASCSAYAYYFLKCPSFSDCVVHKRSVQVFPLTFLGTNLEKTPKESFVSCLINVREFNVE